MELLRSHQLGNTVKASIPLPREWIKSAPEEEKDYDPSILRRAQKITGELLWLSQRTRIDICFSVGLMSSCTTRSPEFVIKIGLRVLAYVANTKNLRLSLVPDGTSAISIYTDASFAPFGERSITGVAVMMSSRCVIWKSRRQTLVSLSTAECELIAAIEGIVLGQSVETLIEELWGGPVDKTLRVDNTAAITLAEGGGSQRTRHLRVRACYLREQLGQNHLKVLHCPGEIQRADTLTKALPAPRLVDLNDMLGLGPPSDWDPAVQAVTTTSRALHRVSPSEGQSILLILALMMIQVAPVVSQEEEEIRAVSLDLYVLGVMLACTILFVWEVGKHCVRQWSCPRRIEASVASVSLEDEEHQQRRHRRQEAVRRAVLREATERLQTVDSDEAHSDHQPAAPPPPPTVQSSSHVHLHVNPPSSTTPAMPSQPMSSGVSTTWTSTHSRTSTNSDVPPPPPPLPSGVARVRETGTVSSRNVCEVGVQTDGLTGLSDQQLCEIELITSSARTPGVLHIFPDCHALRSVSSTNRRSFCRYCLMTLRQRGQR